MYNHNSFKKQIEPPILFQLDTSQYSYKQKIRCEDVLNRADNFGAYHTKSHNFEYPKKMQNEHLFYFKLPMSQ